MGCDNCTCGDKNCGSPILGIKRTVEHFANDFIDEEEE